MQVEKQPSPWPCVLMLAGLLLFCLAAPYYWQHNSSKTKATDAQSSGLAARTPGGIESSRRSSQSSPESVEPNSHSNSNGMHLGMIGTAPNGDLSSIWAPPTIEELIASHSMSGQLNDSTSSFHPQSYDWLSPIAGQRNSAKSTNRPANAKTMSFVKPPNYVTDYLQALGGFVAVYSPTNIAPNLVSRIIEAVPDDLFASVDVTPIAAPSASTFSSLRLVSPRRRMATLPATPRPKPWCVPQVLYEQLQQLAEHTYSAQWASHVRNQLHVLTEREQLVGDDVQSILADLTDAAEEAYRMADKTDDDRLRVALLRAHWCLPAGSTAGLRCTKNASPITFKAASPPAEN